VERLLAALLPLLPAALVARLAGPPIEIRGRRLDPHLTLAMKGAARRTPLHRMSAAEARVATSAALALSLPRPRRMAEVDHRAVAGAAGPLRARLYRPPGIDSPRPLVLYFHQGGFVIGDLDWCEPFCTLLAETARCLVLSVDYRKGPSDRFPAAQEDAVAAYRWALSHAGEVGGDPRRIVVAGDSAGGGLAAHIAQAAKRAGLPQPLLQILIYPWLHAYADNASYRDFGASEPLTRESMLWFLANYARERDREDPRLSPLLEPDVTGLAPALVVTAGFDVLCDEGEAYAKRLEAAGVPVTFRCEESLCHSFTSLGGISPAAARACQAIACDLERTLTREAPVAANLLIAGE
jgi:acetyl esterase/lipase